MLNLSNIIILITFCHQTLSDSCIPPSVPNGDVHGDESGDSWTGEVICHPGFTLLGLLGSNKLKCRDGAWSSNIPVCTAIGQCNPQLLPNVAYAKKFPYKRRTFRGSVYKYSCRKGFQIYGNSLVHCTGDSWSLNKLPICAKTGCDESLVKQVPYGKSKSKAEGSIYIFRCDEGTVLHGSSKVVCDGKKWNDSVPLCASPSLPPSISIEGGTAVNSELLSGSEVTITCKPEGGNPTPALTISIGENEVAYGWEVEGVSHTFFAEEEHNTALVTCMAENMAMAEPISSDTVLNIKFGPQQLSLGGPNSLVQGHAVGYECVSSTSNPPAELHWDLVDQQNMNINHMLKITDSTTSWTGRGWETISTVLVNSEPGVTSLSLTCSSVIYNQKTTISKTNHIGVQFAPDKVTILGPQTVILGNTIKVECTSSPSVPASSLTWSVIQGKEKRDYSTEMDVDQLADGSFVSRSGLELEASFGSDIAVECYANNEVLGKDFRAYAHIIEILSPPGYPLISKVAPLSENNGNQELICSSSPSGNPPARLSWYDSAGMVNSQYVVDEDNVSAKITFVPNLMDRELTCEVSNSALTEPIRNSIKMDLPSATTTTVSESSTDTSTTSTTAIIKPTQFEYDEEEEDDQLDYEDLYSNTETITKETVTQPSININSDEMKIEPVNVESKEVIKNSTSESTTDLEETKTILNTSIYESNTEHIFVKSQETNTNKEIVTADNSIKQSEEESIIPTNKETSTSDDILKQSEEENIIQTDNESVTSDKTLQQSEEEKLIQAEEVEVQKTGKQILLSDESSIVTIYNNSEVVKKSIKSDDTLIRVEKQIMNGTNLLHGPTGLLILIYFGQKFYS